ncbi:type II toxin-antitoxin system YafQ family toxin [Pseudomonas aeruginosa]|nr:hypothetical protein AM469_006223 [Pseudomonas aeruginosa]
MKRAPRSRQRHDLYAKYHDYDSEISDLLGECGLKPVLVALATDQPLDVRYRDHDLSGDWAGYRECHIKPDLLLIYRKSDADTLRLARLGSHSELFG